MIYFSQVLGLVPEGGKINSKTTAQTKAFSLQLIYQDRFLSIYVFPFMDYQAMKIPMERGREEIGLV